MWSLFFFLIGEVPHDLDNGLCARVEEVANEFEVQRSLLEGHDRFVKENITRFIIDVKAILKEFQAKIQLLEGDIMLLKMAVGQRHIGSCRNNLKKNANPRTQALQQGV